MAPTPTPGPAPKPKSGAGWGGPEQALAKQSQNLAVTDPGGQGTDVFGLNPAEQNWSFLTGTAGGTQTPPIAGVIPTVPVPAGIAAPERPTTATALDLMRTFASYASSPDPSKRQDWAATQQQLYQAGAYGSTKPRLGFWGPADAPALLKAFRAYQGVAGPDGAALPVTFAEWLSDAAQTETQNEQTPTAPAAPVAVTDPVQVAAAAQSAAQDALGHVLSKPDLDKFVSSFQGRQLSAQKATTGTVDMPDLSSEASSFAQSEHPQQFANHQAQAYADAFMNMFLPAGSQRGNLTPQTPAA